MNSRLAFSLIFSFCFAMIFTFYLFFLENKDHEELLKKTCHKLLTVMASMHRSRSLPGRTGKRRLCVLIYGYCIADEKIILASRVTYISGHHSPGVCAIKRS